MTILDERPPVHWIPAGEPPARAARRPAGRQRSVSRPLRARPPVAPLHYRGHGIAVSSAAHGRRPVSTSVTLALAGMAALITLWLGALANLSGERMVAPAALPDRLAVVSVQAGETLQQLAGRVAPGVPAQAVVDRIRDLNQLDSAALDAGQTLIAPVG